MRQFITLIFIFLLIQSPKAQSFEIGGEIGFGKSTFDDQISVKNLLGQKPKQNIICGFTCTLKPNISDLTFNTGIFYQHKGISTLFDFLKIPIGVNVEPGKKLKFLIGGGLYLSYLFMASSSVDPEFKNSTYDFLLGFYLRSGIKYQIMPQWNIYVQLQIDFDLTPTYKESTPSHFGTLDYQDISAYGYTLNLGFKYLIRLKK